MPPTPGGVNNGALASIGSLGQYIFINPAEQVVVAIQSAWRQQDDSASVETIELIRAAVRALRAERAP